MQLRETVRNTTAGDRILFSFLILATLGSLFLIKGVLRLDGVRIEVEGKPSYLYPLATDRTVRVKSTLGHLTVEIKNKAVRVVNPSCSNKLCERTGWTANGVIICLPGRITIVVGTPVPSEDGKVDAVTG